MRKFVFTLQRLLFLREHKEKDWETKLGEITSKCTGLKRGIRECERLHGETLKTRAGVLDIASLGASEDYLRRMRVDVLKFKEDLKLAEKKRAEVQKKYLEASRDRKVLDKLKEKQEFEFYREQLKEEMKTIDDINTSAAVRKNGIFSS